MYHLGRRLKAKAARDPRPRNAGLQRADLGLPDRRRRDGEPDVRARSCRRSTAGRVADGSLLPGFTATEGGRHDRVRLLDLLRRLSLGRIATARTSGSREGIYGHGWGFAWPADRRILYNRASARPDGTPWSERKKLVWWDERQREWTGLDVPDFTQEQGARLRAAGRTRRGDEALARRRAVHHAPRRRRLVLGRRRA